MVDEFIHWSKPYPFLSATCDKILSWMIEIWMKNHLVCYNTYNTVNLQSPPPKKKQNYKEWKIMLCLTFSVGDTIQRFTIHIERENQNR